jgi:uncharacterized membrane protein (UPF0127 family)
VRRGLAVLAVAAGLAACGGDGLERGVVTIDTEAGAVEVEVEIASERADRRRGLMGREALSERAGMLFLFEEDRRGGFWMKHTLIPLSIAFMDAGGRIVAMLDMTPCEADPCPRYVPGVAYRSALEVNAGAFRRWGVALGDLVTVER